jgi:hypothetical protein
MPDEVDWVVAVISKARRRSSTTPDAVWAQVEVLLKDKFNERPIPARELKRIARLLIRGMAPPPTELKEPL